MGEGTDRQKGSGTGMGRQWVAGQAAAEVEGEEVRGPTQAQRAKGEGGRLQGGRVLGRQGAEGSVTGMGDEGTGCKGKQGYKRRAWRDRHQCGGRKG